MQKLTLEAGTADVRRSRQRSPDTSDSLRTWSVDIALYEYAAIGSEQAVVHESKSLPKHVFDIAPYSDRVEFANALRDQKVRSPARLEDISGNDWETDT